MNDQQEKTETMKNIIISCKEAAVRLQFKRSNTVPSIS
jgi:hypothetical protein